MPRLMFSAILLFLFAPAPAFADPPTKAQKAELSKLVDGGTVTGADLEPKIKTLPPVRLLVPPPLPPDTYKVTVVCDLKVAIAAGKYDWVDGSINPKNFSEPGCKAGQVEVSLVYYLDRELTNREVLAELDRLGLRPATLPELLALGAAYPDPQRSMWIVALGSSWRYPDGRLIVPILYVGDGERELRLDWFVPGSRWRAGDRFAAVRK